jgi:hypothetical protein
MEKKNENSSKRISMMAIAVNQEVFSIKPVFENCKARVRP